MDYRILSAITSPDDVKKLNNEQLSRLCDEVRDCIITTVSKNGGHLASNLGAVELTIALHRVFSSPEDAIIFDVGHQCYTHKLLTGRFDRFSTIRTRNGISGFMRPDESEHDAFVTGHSSNSISAAYGIYKAKQLSGEKGTAVAVIGDGAMTGGLAYEALNNAGGDRCNFIVVLNDNKMSISRNVGAVARGFTKLRNRPKYHKLKYTLANILPHIPLIGKPIFRILDKVKDGIKKIVYGNNVFTAMGFNYLGPVNGHNIREIEDLLRIAKHYKTPSLVHVVTTKGKGYAYAENKPNNYHGVSPFDACAGAEPSGKQTYSDIAGATLCSLAENNSRVCAITAAMTMGTGLSEFASRFEDRFFDVGIAEQHAVTFAAGLAKGGMIPFFAVYSSFLQRAYDQIIHDAAIAHLPVKLLVDRAGIVGEDGESHQGVFDVPFLTSVPGITVYSPATYNELTARIIETANDTSLCAIRYPRGAEVTLTENFDYSKDHTLISNNSSTAVVTYGRLFFNVLEAVGKQADIIKLNRIYPLEDDVIELISKYRTVHFYEEGIRSGSIAEHVAAALSEKDFSGEYRIHAIENSFIPASDVASSFEDYGFDPQSISNTVLKEQI